MSEEHYYGIRLKEGAFLQHEGKKGMKWGIRKDRYQRSSPGYIHSEAYNDAEEKLQEIADEENDNEEENDVERRKQGLQTGRKIHKKMQEKKQEAKAKSEFNERRKQGLQTGREIHKKTQEAKSLKGRGIGYAIDPRARGALPGSKIGMVQTGSVSTVGESRLAKKWRGRRP